MQGLPSASQSTSFQVAKTLFFREGVLGLYRGGLPLFVGGSLMRSAQFGVSGACKTRLESSFGKTQNRIFGVVDWQVIVAGIAGGVGRGIVETPTDFLKIRRQVEKGWTLSNLMDGAGITLARNTSLFSFFVLYMDFSKQLCQAGYVPSTLMQPNGEGLTPFAKGAICANLAWLTIWPLDVLKTQRQSGNYDGNSFQLLKSNLQSGRMFRGILPGLFRSTIANGSSMVVYEYVHTVLTKNFQLQRKDMT
jgi:solute carrier family 25 carnitine/acylcarnitine transporter 20/29